MKILRLFIYALSCLTILSCSNTKKEKVLVVSIDPQRALLGEIVGDRFEVVSVLTPGSNPETFEPTMKSRRQIENAVAYFETGHLPFERKLKDSMTKGTATYDTSAGIEPVYGTHDHGDNHSHADNADPHVWTSVRNARVMARNMYDAVVELDPEGRGYYEQRYKTLDSRLDSLDRAFAARLGSANGEIAFAIWHPSLSYFARDYDLEQIAVGFENKEMPATVLKSVIDEARDDGVKVLFFQKEFDSRQVESLNKELGTQMVEINPMSYDWEKELDRIVSALCR